jgi:hypothetical protein
MHYGFAYNEDVTSKSVGLYLLVVVSGYSIADSFSQGTESSRFHYVSAYSHFQGFFFVDGFTET